MPSYNTISLQLNSSNMFKFRQHIFDVRFLKLLLNCTSILAAHTAMIVAFFLILVLNFISEKKK